MEVSETTVLCVEDEERLLLGLTAVLRRAGYRVLTASNGSAGLQMARDHQPDVIVCDVMMPPPDGFELRALLAQDPMTASIPFVFLTARTSQADKLRGIEGGADDYITKPFDRQELLARIQAVLRRNELGRQKGLSEATVQLEGLRTTLIDSVSQEMRRPVATLLANLQAILAERYRGDAERIAEFVELATDSARRLESTISDLLTLVTLERSKEGLLRAVVDLDQDVRAPVEGCMDHWRRFELRDLELDLRVAPGVVVHAPREPFRRALFHLVDNACKFSPEGGTVVVDLAANGEGGCTLVVSDSGPGIVGMLRDKVFECFFQAPLGVERMYGGLGLGLTIVRSTARALGGDAVVLDAPAGCTVQMVIPPGPVSWETLTLDGSG